MDDNPQLLNQKESGGKSEQRTAGGLSFLPECSTAESTGHAVCSSGQPLAESSDRRIAPSAGSKECRECLSAMAHRLAQPMTALRGGIELGLMGKRTVADYRALLEQSLQLADGMAQLVISLRDLGESGAPSGPAACLMLDRMTTEVLAEMEGLAQSCRLRLQLCAHREVKVHANPERLREALQSLLAWVIQNSAGGDVIAAEISASDGEALLILVPPRLDLQYLQIKVLEDITIPGLLFSHAAKNGALGWAINQRLLDGLGGKLEILTDGPDAGCIRVRFPLAPEG